MPELTITEDQREYLESLRADLDAEVGPYGHVRERDALQYLIDSHEGDIEEGTGGSANSGENANPEKSDGGTEAEAAESEAAESDGGAGSEDDDAEAEEDDADRLSSMMSLLDEHEDKWRRSDGDDGTYEVDLPGGGTEAVRTKDDVRAVLFKQY